MPICRRCGFPFSPDITPVFIPIPVPMTARVPPQKRASPLKMAWRLLKLCALLFLALLAYRWFYTRRHSFVGEWEDRQRHLHVTFRRDRSVSEAWPDPATGETMHAFGIWMVKDRFLTIQIDDTDPQTFQWFINGSGYVLTLMPEDRRSNQGTLILHRLTTDWRF
jgi:hypothetical protein